jgi:hypothetical protein
MLNRGCRHLFLLTISLTFVSPAIGSPRGRRDQASSPPAQSACHPEDYRLLSSTVIALKCAEKNVIGLTVTSGVVSTVVSVPSGVTTKTKVADATSIRLVKDTCSTGGPPYPCAQWISVTVTAALSPNQNYVLDLCPSAACSQSSVDLFSYTFNTNEIVGLASFMAASHANQYMLTSKLGFQGDQKPGSTLPCTFRYHDYSDKQGTVAAKCIYLNNVPASMTVDIARHLLDRRGLEQVGQVVVDISSKISSNSLLLPVGVEGLEDIFGGPLKLDPKSKFVTQKAPATKDASQYYANVNYAAGVGSKPAWILDGKLAPSLGSLVHGFQFFPLIMADIGHNTINGMAYTDTIDLGGSASRVFRTDNGYFPLQEILFTPGITYETDREFDRDNLLATFDLRYSFAHLYNPQSTRSLRKFADIVKRMKNSSAPTLQPEQIPPPLFGYALDFHTGLEAGGALVNTAVKATSGAATRVVPTYMIARIVPQVHGLIQVWRFSLDSSAAIRYLVATENTVVQLPNKNLILEKLSGWKAYGVINGNWSLDNVGHFAITVAFKDGFAPPKFQRVNTVQVGLTIKY